MRNQRLFIISTAALVAAVGSFPAAARVDATERIGWHGEPMPEGLMRAAEQDEYVWETDGSIMVYVPAGSFPMGSETGEPDERPIRDVHLDAYYLDKYEVSWAQWKSSGLPYSEERTSRLPAPRAPDWGLVDTDPVTFVSWEYAQQYVAWAGKRLPTEAEWEKAARGVDGRTYPWGDDSPTFERAVWNDHPTAKESIAPAECCAAGASPYGAVNMAGNVYEWCQDVYRADYYSTAPAENPRFDGEGRYRVLRGGAFVLGPEDLRSAMRYRLLPQDRAGYLGFRAALDAAPNRKER